ncbi:MAG: hypothetical protein A2622_07435 [Bdellovibrionales bacterium RIFCSPHIGHO2_01_FULL_40_29]|nr:MAG: hypothetical protein A2622_07435 [Bdellovibrionales bacterium RIFCSPHIGHO2_01_FULL_40_29]OFZ34244.1 MAG: hypothetical protein A3D17_04215 [Bdellovibrionales bacterium RIFCSPHIGHO2_02_FULL_40_15]
MNLKAKSHFKLFLTGLIVAGFLISSVKASAADCQDIQRSQVQADIELYRYAQKHKPGAEQFFIGRALQHELDNLSGEDLDSLIQQIEGSIVKAEIFEGCSTEYTREQAEALKMEKEQIKKLSDPYQLN